MWILCFGSSKVQKGRKSCHFKEILQSRDVLRAQCMSYQKGNLTWYCLCISSIFKSIIEFCSHSPNSALLILFDFPVVQPNQSTGETQRDLWQPRGNWSGAFFQSLGKDVNGKTTSRWRMMLLSLTCFYSFRIFPGKLVLGTLLNSNDFCVILFCWLCWDYCWEIFHVLEWSHH